MAKWLKDLFEDYMEEELGEDLSSRFPCPTSPVIGGIYFGSLKSLNENKPNKPLYFLIVDKIDYDIYEVLKVSDRYEFARNSDIILDIGTLKVIIETDNNFYLTENEINKFILIHQIKEEELNSILEFRDGERPSHLKTGLTPLFEEDIRNKFNQEEFNQIKDYHMRIFEILAMPDVQIVELLPEHLHQYEMKYAASTDQKATYKDDMILYQGEDFIELVLDEKYLNKNVKITLDDKVIFEGVLKDQSIIIPYEGKQLDLDSLAEKINIQTEG
jgi:hypothetical protein